MKDYKTYYIYKTALGGYFVSDYRISDYCLPNHCCCVNFGTYDEIRLQYLHFLCEDRNLRRKVNFDFLYDEYKKVMKAIRHFRKVENG